MKKLNLKNVEEATGDFKSPKSGGYECIITDVEDVPEKEYLKVFYDIADGEFKGYYTNLAKEKGWNMPYFIRSYKDTALSFFKGFVTSVENTNKGFKWDEKNEKAFVKKGIGLVLGDETYLNASGEEKHRLYVATNHSASAIREGDFKVPEPKDSTNRSGGTASNSPFANTSEPQTEEAPTSFFSEPIENDSEPVDVPFSPNEDCPF